MTVPNLINPVDVRIKPLSNIPEEENTVWGQELYGDRERDVEITIPAQVHWTSLEYLNSTLGGTIPTSSAYAIILKSDCDRLGYSPQKGDVLIYIGGIEYNMYVVSVSFYDQRHGVFNLIRLELTSLEPVNEG